MSAAGYCLAFSTSPISGASSVSSGSTNSLDTISGVLGMKVLLQMVGGLMLRGAIVSEKFPTPLMFHHPFPDVYQDAFLEHGQNF